jgi:hypothetical protein
VIHVVLFCIFAVFLVLLIATYGERSAWAALCSTGISVASLAGFVLISNVENATQIRAGLGLLARQLPSVLDQKTISELRIAVDQNWSAPNRKDQPRCVPASHAGSMPQNAQRHSDTPFSEGPAPKPAASDPGKVETKKDFEEVSQWPISWLPDDSTLQVSPNRNTSLSITGINISNKPLREVQAILKPDANQGEVKLTVRVEGERFGNETVIPAGARFNLSAPTANRKKHIGGAVLVFRYTYAGQRRVEIFYLTANMIAGLASPR